MRGPAHAEELVCLGLLVLFIVVGFRLLGLGL